MSKKIHIKTVIKFLCSVSILYLVVYTLNNWSNTIIYIPNKDIFLSTSLTRTVKHNETYSPKKSVTDENFLDGCYHVYLDVGSNIGVQIRKLFEPEKYPHANVHSIFNSHFGNIYQRRNSKKGGQLCAVGFEPNSHHTSYLKSLESSYTKCGWKVRMMTETAVSDRNGVTQFNSDKNYKKMEWGGNILTHKGKNFQKHAQYASLLRLSDFLKYTV